MSRCKLCFVNRTILPFVPNRLSFVVTSDARDIVLGVSTCFARPHLNACLFLVNE